MPLTGQKQTISEDGQEKEGYSVDFTNGAYDQLKELAAFYKGKGFAVENELDVLKFAISILERSKQQIPPTSDNLPKKDGQ